MQQAANQSQNSERQGEGINEHTFFNVYAQNTTKITYNTNSSLVLKLSKYLVAF